MKPPASENSKAKLNREQREGEETEGAAFDELTWGIAEALNKKDIVKALAKYIEAAAKQRNTVPWLGAAFSMFIFCGIGVLGYLKVINSEATIGLLSAVLGVWYGQSARRG